MRAAVAILPEIITTIYILGLGATRVSREVRATEVIFGELRPKYLVAKLDYPREGPRVSHYYRLPFYEQKAKLPSAH